MSRIEISIETNLKQVLPAIQQRMSKKNFKFAVAKTLTQLAQEAQKQVQREMPTKFTIRRPWIVKGIRIRPAARDRLEAYVYSMDSGGRRGFMTRQEFGGIKTPEGGNHIAIPLKAIQPNKRRLIPDVMKPKALLGGAITRTNKRTGRVSVISSGSFKAIKVTAKKTGNEYIMIKVGTVQGKNLGGARGGRYAKYVPAWLLTPRAKIKRTDFLTGPTRKIVKDRTNILLIKNMYEAIRSRR